MNYELADKIKSAYDEIFELIYNYKDMVNIDLDYLKKRSQYHLFGIKLKEEYGLDIKLEHIQALDWNNFGEYLSIGLFGEKYRRTISWSDDGRQPEDELLLRICFSTGAYIFGDDYPQELFKTFFDEVKTYQPKYTDTTNKILYFSMDNAAKIFNGFKEILNKYYELDKRDKKIRQIKKLQSQLNILNKE